MQAGHPETSQHGRTIRQLPLPPRSASGVLQPWRPEASSQDYDNGDVPQICGNVLCSWPVYRGTARRELKPADRMRTATTRSCVHKPLFRHNQCTKSKSNKMLLCERLGLGITSSMRMNERMDGQYSWDFAWDELAAWSLMRTACRSSLVEF
jgi:hypothetical protein